MSDSDRFAGTLEDRLRRLEVIVTELAREDVQLEEALCLFEEGIQHLRAAQEYVERAEQRVERLCEHDVADRPEDVGDD